MNDHTHFCLLTLTYDYTHADSTSTKNKSKETNGGKSSGHKPKGYPENYEFNIDEITYCFKKIGKTNVPLDFLRNDCREYNLSKKMEKRKKCSIISEDIIQQSCNSETTQEWTQEEMLSHST